MKDPQTIKNITLETHAYNNLSTLIQQSMGHLEELVDSDHLVSRERTMAISGALVSTNALLGAVSAKCTRATPPEDIEVTQDNSGRLIYRCYHSPAHKWGWNGQPLP